MDILKMIVDFLLSIVIVMQSSYGLPVLSLSFKFDANASVFETGDDMYTVMWSTTRTGSGYVTYTYEGREYTVTDQLNGCIRSDDTFHSVRVPKAHLNNNTYVYHSQYVGKKFGYSAVKGQTISSEPVSFKGYNGQETIHVLTLSDIHEEPEPVDKAVANFQQSPDLLVLNGDISSTMVDNSQFLKILQYAHRYSGGQIPVAYTRGNHETRGGFADTFPTYFKTQTGSLYYSFDFGPIHFLALDSGEDKPDDHKEYSGLVDFKAYIAEETRWLQAQKPCTDATYNVTLVHMPQLEDRYGNNWVPLLSDLSMDAVISGHLHRLDLNYETGTAPFYRIVDGGKNTEAVYIATMLTFQNGQMQATCYDAQGALCGEQTYAF